MFYQWLYFRASVELTDLPEFVELMKSNVELNKSSISGSVSARSLVWCVLQQPSHNIVLCTCMCVCYMYIII